MSLEEALKELEEKTQKVKDLEVEVLNLKLENNSLKKMVFGSKRESLPSKKEEQKEEQCSLFDTEEEIEEDVQKQIEEKVEEITIYKKKKSKRKKAGIKKNKLKDVVVERHEYIINEDEVCPKCNSKLKKVGKKVVRQEIRFKPAEFIIDEYVINVYKCKKCGTEESEQEKSTFVNAEAPNPLLTHSFVSPSLATEVIYEKYCLGVPLYRQEKMWDDRGLVLPRSMMAYWNIKLTEYYFNNLYNLMLKEIKANSELLHCDETTMQCNKEPGRNATSNSYMWVLRSGELEKNKGVIFKYAPSRSAETAQEFLKGYKNILITDGYASYNNIEGAIHAECWAHTRRYFYDSVPLDDNKNMITTSDGYKGVEFCDKLFKIEREIADLKLPEKLKIRQERSKLVLDEFFEWVSKMSEKIIINKKLKKAITYAQNQQKELSEFLNDARIPLSNSLAERAIRPFAVHRKNWLFADSVDGAKANAIIYSLIESSKVNKLNVYKYINYLLEQLPQLEDVSEFNLQKYLPWSNELPDEILNYQGTESEDPVVTEEK